MTKEFAINLLKTLRTAIEGMIKHEGKLCEEAATGECVCVFGSRNYTCREILRELDKSIKTAENVDK